MEHIYLAILLGALILAGVAKLVRSSGQSHILTVDYARIANPQKLHQRAAKYLMQAARASALLALAAFVAPFYGVLFLALFCFLVFGTAVAITLGVRKLRCA